MKDKEEVDNIFNNFFVNIVPTLGIKTEHEVLNTTDNSQDPIENAICKYENHPSIIFAKKHWKAQVLPLFLRLSQKRKLKNQ